MENAIKVEFTEQEWEVISKLPEAALLELKNIIKRINYMQENDIVEKLKSFYLDTEGDLECLRQKLKNSYKTIIPACVDVGLCPDLLPYYVIIDFEATCGEVNRPGFSHEIIEFPAVIVNSKNQEITDSFQMYCKPQINPKITRFCTELTGITQEQVDSAETFDKVLEHFKKWLAKHNLEKKNYVIVTDGPWDMSRFFYNQCHYSDVKVPKWATKWVNIRKTFSKFYNCERVCLKNMLKYLGMDFIGRPHCGLDDAKNIARILLRMIYDGADVQINERVTCSKKPREEVKSESDVVVNGGCDGNVLDNEMDKLRIKAHYATVYSTRKVPIYKTTRRARLTAEVRTARKIFGDHNSDVTNNETKPKSRRKRKVKKES